MSLYTAIVIPLAFVSGIWIPITLLCCSPWVQKQMLYLHWVTLWPGKWLTEPERAGFLKNQTASFRIPTKDGERLFAWLMAPLGLYSKHADEFIGEPSSVDADIEQRVAFDLLRNDTDARLVVYFHGNTGTIAQGRRTEEYRMYSSGASDKMFVLAFDYRGFGQSTGTPSESGLLNDAEAVIDWALTVACVSPDRIVLLGHSLGTAVATGIAHRYMNLDHAVQFSGLILCAAFTNTANAFSSYSIANLLPLLAPVRMIPSLQTWFGHQMCDTWETSSRLTDMARRSNKFQLMLVHAEDDMTMPWNHTEELFKSTLKAAMEGALTDDEALDKVRVIDLGESGRQETWCSGRTRISKLIAKHGGK
ncbi:alpha/beta-hydrolase [Pleomassaria siparia CBS 279.74]|uniref:Alpha/beta-hydrolase n=1 Tax=Pleomassaria siparia CBS 279.74 TaxID=1314801 RepID=A0A6G1K7Z8_9PLEO|nr:alpha/beta-hydrolase [Pleomassaria siparia CBS 279.74]